MNKPNLYQVTSREVDPVSDVLKAVVELNWHVHRAERAGWSIRLEATELERIEVTVERTGGWPNDESEEEA